MINGSLRKYGLGALKEEYGDRITFVGGLNKFFFEWNEKKNGRGLKDVLSTGRKGGGYIFMDSSGSMPENLSKEKFDFYMNLSKELREK